MQEYRIKIENELTKSCLKHVIFNFTFGVECELEKRKKNDNTSKSGTRNHSTQPGYFTKSQIKKNTHVSIQKINRTFYSGLIVIVIQQKNGSNKIIYYIYY